MVLNSKRFIANLKPSFFRDKKVLVRVDYNVSIKTGKILDGSRITRSFKTIDYILKNKAAKIIIVSHRWQPKRPDREHSLWPVFKYLCRVYKNIGFFDFLKSKSLPENRIVLFENLRFHPGERKNDYKFAKFLASFADIYINDAFSGSHRKNASIVAITKFLPAYAGFLMQEEVENLAKLFRPLKPYLVIFGGAKISDKFFLVKSLVNKANKVLTAGAIANTLLAAQGYQTGKSLIEKDLINNLQIKKISQNKKVFIPYDFYVLRQGQKKRVFLTQIAKNDKVFDIGPASLNDFFVFLKKAKTIVWNGPLGYFEDKRFASSTLKLAKFLAKQKSFRVIGGGDTLAAIVKLNLNKKFNFVSTGGGAMLEFLAGKKLPGIKALKLIKRY